MTGILEDMECLEEGNEPTRSRKRKHQSDTRQRNKKIKNHLKEHENRALPNCRCKCRDKVNESIPHWAEYLFGRVYLLVMLPLKDFVQEMNKTPKQLEIAEYLIKQPLHVTTP